MECPRCHSRDEQFLYKVNNQYYCRHCIAFSRVYTHIPRLTKRLIFPKNHVIFKLNFKFSPQQQKISLQLLKCYQSHQNAYVWAVCGSGKTEIIFPVIQYALNQGHRVCFCVPRKELVKELYERIQTAFTQVEIGIAYGGLQKNLDAQFIVCTMHQLYRFENNIGFDLMIADEIDAFPFYGNPVLNQIFHNCCLGTFIKMSATLEEKDIHDGQVFVMNRRYHGYDLPVPKSILSPLTLQKIVILLIVYCLKQRIIIYVPTRETLSKLCQYLLKCHIRCVAVCAQYQDNQQKIQDFIKGKYDVLLSTTLLERGITIENVQVVVYQGNHRVFDWRTLIQIAGRVGRKPNFPSGHIYILSSEQTIHIRKCIKTIKLLNKMSV